MSEPLNMGRNGSRKEILMQAKIDMLFCRIGSLFSKCAELERENKELKLKLEKCCNEFKENKNDEEIA